MNLGVLVIRENTGQNVGFDGHGASRICASQFAGLLARHALDEITERNKPFRCLNPSAVQLPQCPFVLWIADNDIDFVIGIVGLKF